MEITSLADGMDPSVRPQDDLFGHVNGRWLAEATIPPDLPSFGAFVRLQLDAEEHVREVLDEANAQAANGQAAAGSSLAQLGDFFASFLDEQRVESLGAEPIAADLAAVEAVDDLGQFAALLGRLERGGVGGVVASHVDSDDGRSERNIVKFHQAGIGLPDEAYYREDSFAEVREKYVEHIAAMLGLIDTPDSDAAAERVMELEARLAAGHWDNVASRDVVKTYNLTTWDELLAAAPAFDWAGWVEELGGSPEAFAEIVVRQPSYLTALSEVLQDVSLADWKTWLRWRVVSTWSPYLSSPFVEENFNFYGHTLAGTEEQRARWKRGVAVVEDAMGEAIGKEYVDRHFPPEAKQRMDRLVANLVEAYRQSIGRLDWMGQQTRAKALAKLDKFLPKIGYPDKWRDYSSLVVDREDLIGNVRRAAAFETDRQLAKLGQPVDRGEWLMYPQTVNAYYKPGSNEICFPAAILRPPFFDPDADDAANYGGIGAVIGHEIGHGFDDQGSQYDGDGNLVDWWTAEDRERFQQRADALIGQYNGFEPRDLPGHRVNGALTVGENIGDLGGLAIAIKAYEISLNGSIAPVSDGQSAVQRALCNWALVWRAKRREAMAIQLLAVDPHSPPEFRANIVRNLDEFHSAFDTLPGDGLWLEPSERVRIW